MKRSGRVPWVEVRVGMVILFAFAVLMWAAFNGTGMTVFEKTSELHAYFDDVGGLVSGSPVWLGGIEVGHVSKIEFVEVSGVGKVHVAFDIKEEAWSLVSDSSIVSVGTMGLMGDKYISLTVRQTGQPPAQQGNTLRTSTDGGITAMFASVPDLMDSVKVTIQRLNVTLGRVERGEGVLGRLTTDGPTSDAVDELIVSSGQAMRELAVTQRRLVASMDNITRSVDSISYGMLHGGGTFSRLIWDSSLYVGLRDVSLRSDALLTKWESGNGTIAKFTNDSMLYAEMRGVVSDSRRLIDQIMANPKKFFKFSVF